RPAAEPAAHPLHHPRRLCLHGPAAPAPCAQAAPACGPCPMNRMKLRPSRACLSALALAAALSGCAVTRKEPPSPMSVPAQFKEAAQWQPAAPQAVTPEDWWTVFGDPVLNDLESRLVVDNENLKAAVAQVANARAVLDAARLAPFPTLSAS